VKTVGQAALRAQMRDLLRTTSPEILRYFERRVERREDAADLLGDTLLVAWRKVDTMPVGDRDRHRAWLFTIAAHVLSNHRRSTRRRGALTDRLRGLLAFAPVEEDASEGHAVRDAVSRLPEGHRELVRLVHWDGLSLNEAAAVIGINASTARSRYAAARKTLRVELDDADEDARAVSHG